MTILNAFIAANRMLIAADTMCWDPKTGKRHDGFTKIVPLSGIHAIVASRGDMSFLRTLVGTLLLTSASLEEIAEGLGSGLCEHIATKLETGDQEVLFAGWSRAQSRMRAWEYKVRGAKSCDSREIIGAYISPNDVWDGSDPDTEERMSVLARRQCAWMRENKPDLATGGNLVLMELTQDLITIARGVSL